MPPKGSSSKPNGRPGGSRGPSGAATSSAPAFPFGYAPAYGAGGPVSSAARSAATVAPVTSFNPRAPAFGPPPPGGGFYLAPAQPDWRRPTTGYDPQPAPFYPPPRPLFPPLAPAPRPAPLMPPPPAPVSQIRRLRALRDQVAPNGAPDGFIPTGRPGDELPNPLPAGRPMLSNPYHINPKESNKGRKYGAYETKDPHSNAIPPLDIQITLMEILTFFPAWFTIPDVAMRAKANYWGRKHLAKADVDVRNQPLNAASMKKSEDRFQKDTSHGGKMYFGIPDDERWSQEWVKKIQPYEDMTANMWELRGSYTKNQRTDWGHIRLLPVAQRVPTDKWPEGMDRSLLTKCLEFVLDDFKKNGDRGFDTSHWHLIIDHNNWDVPGAGIKPWMNGAVVDLQARKRLHERVSDP